MLTIRELSLATERSHRLLECWASATRVRTDGNLVPCDVWSDARIQPNDATVARLRYHGDGTEARFKRLGGAHGESLRLIGTSGSALHHLAVSLAWVAVSVCRDWHRVEIRRGRGRGEEASWGDRLFRRKLKACCFEGKNLSQF